MLVRHLRRLSRTSGLTAAVIVVGVVIFAVLEHQAARTVTRLAFWFEEEAFTLPPWLLERLGGPLTPVEEQTVMQLSRAEVEQAFAGLRLRVVDNREGFWRVAVVPDVALGRPLPVAGNALPLGPLGGMALVGVGEVSANAVHYAPHGASRQVLLEGIARGIGRVAAHEVAHQIVGVRARHNDADQDSYEYPSPARAVQYYGELQWTTWWPELQRLVGS